jgi:hypothetical protein
MGGGVQEVGAPVSGEAGLSAGSSMERRRWVGQEGVEGEREADGLDRGLETVWGDLVYCHKLRVSIPARLHVKKNLLPQISRQSPLGPK